MRCYWTSINHPIKRINKNKTKNRQLATFLLERGERGRERRLLYGKLVGEALGIGGVGSIGHLVEARRRTRVQALAVRRTGHRRAATARANAAGAATRAGGAHRRRDAAGVASQSLALFPAHFLQHAIADVVGAEIVEEKDGKRGLNFVKGPIFTNILLADEINRTPPKTQSSLLEAMEERQVTAAGVTYPMAKPFFVLATQNPIELEGTYPLPEAQLDRFMFKIELKYLSEADEVAVVANTTQTRDTALAHPLSGEDILEFQRIARQVPAAEAVIQYAVRLVHSSRPQSDVAPQFIKDWVSWGAGIRASQNLILAGKVRALLHGRYNVSFGDVRALAPSVLRHRVLLNFHAEAERITTDTVIARLLEEVPEPSSGL